MRGDTEACLASFRGIVIEALEHEAHQVIPVIERQVVDQGTEMLEECSARGPRITNSTE